jgi:hypothetical protein
MNIDLFKTVNDRVEEDKLMISDNLSYIDINYPKCNSIETINIIQNDIVKLEENNDLFNEEVIENKIIDEIFTNINILKKNDTCQNLLIIENSKKDSKEDDDDFFDFIESCDYTKFNLDILSKEFYEKPEEEENLKSTNYNNEHFCYYCKNYMVMPDYEIINFLKFHLSLKKYSKYLILVFRLCPFIFNYINVMENKYLRKFIFNYLNISDCYSNAINLDIFNKYNEKYGCYLKTHVYENLFHQPNLTFFDYIKCDSCKKYLCPMHRYLSNCYYKKCQICNNKLWTICGWCKSSFNEEIACKYIHKKN